uniref:Uncharacterized protein n=1 Tax=Fibrocapsa japonica TaxID=94617 RepID=A0A7S2UYC6_9STRA|eukprot:CAMPEP_0113943088 /NCGR_PEP_ID=MMETSP1339-20121228/19170_1 /TAXON_ID=94617 /ORGANISM="Fibrocapsa japonica" /LENGTH=216 /DNA_ID=CAMNT_0000947853 /DNA_START=29 /DNA_END=679 /DNA_ORIENTATION=- /assembly_acc=CAM_ASM_000762
MAPMTFFSVMKVALLLAVLFAPCASFHAPLYPGLQLQGSSLKGAPTLPLVSPLHAETEEGNTSTGGQSIKGKRRRRRKPSAASPTTASSTSSAPAPIGRSAGPLDRDPALEQLFDDDWSGLKMDVGLPGNKDDKPLPDLAELSRKRFAEDTDNFLKKLNEPKKKAAQPKKFEEPVAVKFVKTGTWFCILAAVIIEIYAQVKGVAGIGKAFQAPPMN